ncbi:MAG: DUF11 domain-containing protein [Actinobacteria bacterium]|nr:MAG: DUF11 domain-containing protein [Actinomycetota bacterium]
MRHARSRRIGRVATAVGALLVGLAWTTSVAEALVATPDVTLATAVSAGSPGPATSFTWTLVARNSGAATAHDVVVSSPLPAGVTVVFPPPPCMVGSAVRCTLGDLDPGARVRVQLDVSIQQGTCGELRSVVAISASDEPAVARNDDTAVASASVDCPTATLVLAATPDLVVDVTSDATGPIQKGHAVRYSMTVANAGSAVAHHVVVTDRLPSGVEPINLLPKMDGGSCSAVGSTEGRAAFTIICVRSALDPGASAVVTIDIRVGANRSCGPMLNHVTVSANDEPGAARANDSATQVDRVLCAPSIQLSSQGPHVARVGDHVRSVYAVTNDGEVSLHALSLRASGCVLSYRRHAGPLRPGHVWSVLCERTIGAKSSDRLAIAAQVTARTPDGTLIHDATAAGIRVIHPGLFVAVRTSMTSAHPGDVVTYTFVLRNTGDSVIRGISIVHDRLGLVGHIGALRAGGTVRLTSGGALSGVPETLLETTTATGTDLSGSPVSGRTTTSLTVLATRSGSGHAGTAFTGSDVGGAGAAAIALLAIGIVALQVGSRGRNRRLTR